MLYPKYKQPLKLMIFVELTNKDLYECLLLYWYKMISFSFINTARFSHFIYFFLIRSVFNDNNKPNLYYDNPDVVILIICFK